MTSLRLRLVYDGLGPVHWSGGAAAFGLQDKAGVLHRGTTQGPHVTAFDFELQVKAGTAGAVVLLGDFAHGSPAERFLYLGWREPAGNFAQRLKVPLSTITATQVREAQERQVPLVAILRDHAPRATSTRANIGGTRAVPWAPG
jgi:hypothetical protein